MPIYINTRVRGSRLSGVHRYTAELERRMGGHVRSVAPLRPMRGMRGHLWEQAVLPAMVRGGLVWSPANSGPLAVRKQVLTVHDVASLEHPEWYSRAFGAWYRWMTPRLVNRVQRVITVSEFSKQRLLALTGVDELRVTVIPGGVDGRFYPRPAEEVRRVRNLLGIPSAHYVVSVSTLEPRKNLPRLLAAWASCAPHLLEEMCLVIAGSEGPGQVFGKLDLGSAAPRVHITGFISEDDLPALYSGAMAVAYVSLYEGFGLPVLEGMACGAVPVAANNTALPELVGDAGLLVDPFDCEAIAAGIKRVVQSSGLRRKLKERATERSKDFTWERAASRTWRVLRAEARAAQSSPDAEEGELERRKRTLMGNRVDSAVECRET